MTVEELIETIVSIDSVWIKFKPMEKDMVLIFWKEHYPIASVFLKDVNFRVDYPRLYDMENDEITKIFDSLEAYVQTDLLAREINF